MLVLLLYILLDLLSQRQMHRIYIYMLIDCLDLDLGMKKGLVLDQELQLRLFFVQ